MLCLLAARVASGTAHRLQVSRPSPCRSHVRQSQRRSQRLVHPLESPLSACQTMGDGCWHTDVSQDTDRRATETQRASLLPRGTLLSLLFGDCLVRREPIYAALRTVAFRRRTTKASADAFRRALNSTRYSRLACQTVFSAASRESFSVPAA